MASALLVATILTVVICTTADGASKECFDKSIDCPSLRNSCKKDTSKTLCPASCHICKSKSKKATDSEAKSRMDQCCKANKMTKACAKNMCRYNPTKNDIATAYSDGKCEWSDAKIWMVCASDGNDNTKCCKDKEVASKCLGFCEGKFNKTIAQGCIWKYLDSIVSCNRDAMKSYE